MNQLKPDPDTGFLESYSPNHRSFDVKKKVRFIELVKEHAQRGLWPRVSKICTAVDVGIQTFRDHLVCDPEFKAAYEEAMAPVEDNLVDNLWKQGQNANGITANIFLLKSRWPERWGEKSLNISIDSGMIKELTNRSTQSIDAEIVENTGLISTPSNQVDKSTNVSDVKKEL